MTAPKTVTLPRKKAKGAGKSKGTDADKRPCAPDATSRGKVRERAYYKWEAAGCPCSDGVAFWLQAEAELLGDTPTKGETSVT